METLISQLTEIYTLMTGSPTWLILLVVINLLCIWLQTAHFFDNKWVPVVAVILGALGWYFFGDCGAVSPAQRHPRGVLALQGFIIGAIAYLLHGVLVAAWRKKFPDETPSINPLKP